MDDTRRQLVKWLDGSDEPLLKSLDDRQQSIYNQILEALSDWTKRPVPPTTTTKPHHIR